MFLGCGRSLVRWVILPRLLLDARFAAAIGRTLDLVGWSKANSEKMGPRVLRKGFGIEEESTVPSIPLEFCWIDLVFTVLNEDIVPVEDVVFSSEVDTDLLEQGCFTSHLLSFDNNKVLKIINWIC